MLRPGTYTRASELCQQIGESNRWIVFMCFSSTIATLPAASLNGRSLRFHVARLNFERTKFSTPRFLFPLHGKGSAKSSSHRSTVTSNSLSLWRRPTKISKATAWEMTEIIEKGASFRRVFTCRRGGWATTEFHEGTCTIEGARWTCMSDLRTKLWVGSQKRSNVPCQKSKGERAWKVAANTQIGHNWATMEQSLPRIVNRKSGTCGQTVSRTRSHTAQMKTAKWSCEGACKECDHLVRWSLVRKLPSCGRLSWLAALQSRQPHHHLNHHVNCIITK